MLLLAGCRGAGAPAAEPAAMAGDSLGQLLLVGVPGVAGEGNAELDWLLCEIRAGGVLLFARNVADSAQITRLTGWMRQRSRACAGTPVLVAVDAEGGQVMRLGQTAGYTETLSHGALGEEGDLALTELEALRIGGRLREAGIDWNLAPVVDVGLNPANAVIVGRGRSFGGNARLVTAHARAYLRGLRAAGVLGALKHFPGHGSSFADSHEGFVDVSETASQAAELLPYRTLIAEALVDVVMTAHVFNRHLDPAYPATLSGATIAGLLRGALGFDGVVVSDDLRMAAIERRYGLASAAVAALRAGVDVLLIADDRTRDGRSASAVVLAAVREALATGALPAARVAAALERVARLKESVRGRGAEAGEQHPQETGRVDLPGEPAVRRPRVAAGLAVRTDGDPRGLPRDQRGVDRHGHGERVVQHHPGCPPPVVHPEGVAGERGDPVRQRPGRPRERRLQIVPGEHGLARRVEGDQVDPETSGEHDGRGVGIDVGVELGRRRHVAGDIDGASHDHDTAGPGHGRGVPLDGAGEVRERAEGDDRQARAGATDRLDDQHGCRGRGRERRLTTGR
jgi:beta-N-acetylhexosaminidase